MYPPTTLARIEWSLLPLFSCAEIRFTNGTIEGAEPCGPIVASGPMADGREYRALKRLRNLQGLSAPKATRRVGILDLLGWKRRLLRFWESLEALRASRARWKDFTDIHLTIVGDLSLNEVDSEFPPVPAEQVQIYDGNLKLSWSAGEIIIRATVTLKYAPDPNAYITGFMEGDMEPPIEPFFNRHVTATCNSRNPGRFGEPCHAEETETYVVEDFVLRSRLDSFL